MPPGCISVRSVAACACASTSSTHRHRSPGTVGVALCISTHQPAAIHGGALLSTPLTTDALLVTMEAPPGTADTPPVIHRRPPPRQPLSGARNDRWLGARVSIPPQCVCVRARVWSAWVYGCECGRGRVGVSIVVTGAQRRLPRWRGAGVSILLHGFSNVVVQTLKSAAEGGVRFRAICTEGQPECDGRKTAEVPARPEP